MIEQIEIDRYRAQLTHDLNVLIEKYRAIFDWDIPDIDQKLADSLLIGEAHRAIDEIQRANLH